MKNLLDHYIDMMNTESKSIVLSPKEYNKVSHLINNGNYKGYNVSLAPFKDKMVKHILG